MHGMTDLETMSTRKRAAITQIAIVEFEPVPGGKVKVNDAFNCGVALHGQKRHVDPDTLCWWLDQSQPARANFIECQNTGLPLDEALQRLTSWYQTRNVQAVWGHGSAFDVAILEDAYEQAGSLPPWGHRDARDTRTLFWHKNFAMRHDRPRGTEHDALADAIFQAEEVQYALALR